MRSRRVAGDYLRGNGEVGLDPELAQRGIERSAERGDRPDEPYRPVFRPELDRYVVFERIVAFRTLFELGDPRIAAYGFERPTESRVSRREGLARRPRERHRADGLPVRDHATHALRPEKKVQQVRTRVRRDRERLDGRR
jgi:hypothetical protein